MRVWTIQPVVIYEMLKVKGVLFADGRRADKDWTHAYSWMIEQMRHRLPLSKGHSPWWGWYRYQGLHRAKPDLRAGGHLPKGQRGIRIELDLDPEEVLLSDFDDWWWPLINSFFPQDEAEEQWFCQEERKLGRRLNEPYPEPLKTKVYASWERIFDLTQSKHDWLGRFSERSIQATFWELRLKDVQNVTFFTDRGRGY